MTLFFRIFDVFTWHPARIWCVSAVLGVLFLLARMAKTRYCQVQSLPLLIVSVVWLAYGFWEQKAHRARWNIRVDLLLIDPVLFFGTTTAILLSARSVFRTIQSSHGE